MRGFKFRISTQYIYRVKLERKKRRINIEKRKPNFRNGKQINKNTRKPEKFLIKCLMWCDFLHFPSHQRTKRNKREKRIFHSHNKVQIVLYS